MTTGSPDASLPALRERLRKEFVEWRRLGVLQGSLTAAWVLERLLAGRLRRIWLARHPLQVRPDELRSALGGLTATEALRGPALQALPTVGSFEQSLTSLPSAQRADLLRRAEMITGHVFDLLGSGPTHVGSRIDWQRDFKADHAWPLRHCSSLTISYPGDSDIKVPWELSRFQHLPLLAAAFRLTGEERYLDEIGAQLSDWIDANPVEFGANWACTMDVAIRAANWIAALTLLTGDERGAAAPWIENALGSLLLHGRFIRSHLEWARVRGNHYLANVVGLLTVAAVFSHSEEGHTWAAWATREIVAELEHQVREDGCDHEASIAYHRLVAEMFVCGLRAAETLVPAGVGPAAWKRLDRMLDFTAAYTRPDGLAPQIGDADDGRYLPLGDYGALDHRCHDHLFAQAGRQRVPTAGSHAAFPQGGWYVMRAGPLQALVRCGDVGIGGLGSHSHCDQLAFELCFGEQPLIVDPGTYLYTADLAARAAFRATAAHATLEIGAAEQNPIHVDRPFQMEDRSRAELCGWQTSGTRAVFAGRHHGYQRLRPPASHERLIDFDGDARIVTVTDVVRSAGSHRLRWSLPLAQGEVELNGGDATVRFPTGVCLSIEAPELRFELVDGWSSPSYGVRNWAPVLRAQRMGRPGEDVASLTLRVFADGA
jgi:hypothetical protein